MPMSTKKLIEYAGIGALVYLGLKYLGGFVASYFSVGVPRFKVKSFKPTFFEGTLFLPITNNTPATIPIDGFKGKIMYGQYKLADIAVNQQFNITAKDTADMPVNVYVGYGDLSGNLYDLISSGSLLQSLRVTGHVFSRGVVVPIDNTIQIL